MSKPLRILHCMRAPVGGLFRHVLDLAAEQAARGHDVGILADKTASDPLTDERFAAIEPKLTLGLHRAPMSRKPGLGDLAAARLTSKLARALAVGVLHGHGAKGGAYARLAGQDLRLRRRKIASFYTPHGGSLNFAPGSLEGRIYLNLEKLLTHCTTGLIFESDYARRVYGERVGAGRVPVRVIPNGLQPADFIVHAPDAGAADVLFVGELRHLKGVDVLLDALKAIESRHPASAVIVGAGPDAQGFKDQAASLGLASRVRFPGPMPAAQAFPLGRTLVVPSRAESFPYIVLEAGAAGMPLIATNVGGIPEITAGTGTDLIAPGDVAALAGALQKAIADPDAAKARAQRLKARVAERFTVTGMAASVLAFYAEAGRL